MPQVRSLLATGRTVRPLLLGSDRCDLACSRVRTPRPSRRSSPTYDIDGTVTDHDPRRQIDLCQLPSTTTTTIVTTESLPAGSSLVGHASADVEIFDSPELAAPSYVLEPATILGSPRVFLVESGPVDGWVEVSLPIRPNGSTGWVRAGALDLSVLDYTIFVDLSDRMLRLEQSERDRAGNRGGGRITATTRRQPASYFVTDVVELADPPGPWGPFALGLSAFSDTITEFNGGDGIIGIHGTNRPASIGEPVSLGCVRVPNEIAALLADLVKLGTPVEIQA